MTWHAERRRARAALEQLGATRSSLEQEILALLERIKSCEETLTTLQATPTWISYKTQSKRQQAARGRVKAHLRLLLKSGILDESPLASEPFVGEFYADPVGMLVMHGIQHPPFQALLDHVEADYARESRPVKSKHPLPTLDTIAGLRQGHGLVKPLRVIASTAEILASVTASPEFATTKSQIDAAERALQEDQRALGKTRAEIETIATQVAREEVIAHAPRHWPQFSGVRWLVRHLRWPSTRPLKRFGGGIVILSLLVGCIYLGAFLWEQARDDGNGGTNTFDLGTCQNATDCITYSWPNFRVGIAPPGTPYQSPYPRVNATQRGFLVGDLEVRDGSTRAPANTSCVIAFRFTYPGVDPEALYRVDFLVDHSVTGAVAILEAIFDVGANTVWCLCWLDGSSIYAVNVTGG